MEDIKDSDIAAMTQLHTDIAEQIQKAIEEGMAEELANYVVGNVALQCMKRMPYTDDGADVVQNFMIQVDELLGEPETTTRH
jgi:hypothetical protein